MHPENYDFVYTFFMGHPLAPLCELKDITDLTNNVASNLAQVHRHRNNIRHWGDNSATANTRSARASALLESAKHTDALFPGALRCYDALDPTRQNRLGWMISIFRRSPLQAIARIHTLAAKDITPLEYLGRPVLSPQQRPRLTALAELITSPLDKVPVSILASIVHAEILGLQVFQGANGIVARTASRLVVTSFGLDTYNLGVPEVYWLRKQSDYRSAIAEYLTGSEDGVRAWLLICLEGLLEGSAIAKKIADDYQQKP